MHIEVDFEVWKELTSRLESEADSYNSVIRRALMMPSLPEPEPRELDRTTRATQQVNALAAALSPGGNPARSFPNALAFQGGAWFANTHFPEGTQFRGTYKGRTYTAQIKNGRWIDEEGTVRTSPSEAASAISNTSVNGWRFWYARRPGEDEWHRIDALKH